MKENFGRFAIAVAILLSTVIYAFATRYQISAAGSQYGTAVFVLDRWTGQEWKIER